jgi:hypothetical protein
MPIIPILLILATATVVGLLGSTRRIGFLIPFLLSFVITPIGAALVAIITGRKVRARKKKTSK